MLDYTLAFNEHQSKNIESLQVALRTTEISDPHLLKKIVNWANKFHLSVDSVMHKVRTDPVFACIFSIDPNKQGIHEKTAAKYIAGVSNIQNFKILPKSGKAAKTVYNGSVCPVSDLRSTKNSIRGETPMSKSIDFEFDIRVATKSIHAYATHKYINESGGNQDGQYMDVELFLSNAWHNTEDNTIFIAFCDGGYFHTPNRSGITKSVLTKTRYGKEKTTYVLETDGLPALIDQLSFEFSA
jgi:hypothetical protein